MKLDKSKIKMTKSSSYVLPRAHVLSKSKQVFPKLSRKISNGSNPLESKHIDMSTCYAKIEQIESCRGHDPNIIKLKRKNFRQIKSGAFLTVTALMSLSWPGKVCLHMPSRISHNYKRREKHLKMYILIHGRR